MVTTSPVAAYAATTIKDMTRLEFFSAIALQGILATGASKTSSHLYLHPIEEQNKVVRRQQDTCALAAVQTAQALMRALAAAEKETA